MKVLRHEQIAVASFAAKPKCKTTHPSGFAKLNLEVLRWIQSIKVDSWKHKTEMELQVLNVFYVTFYLYHHIKNLKKSMQTMETPVGVWCGYREKAEQWNAIIKYDRLTISASNLGTGLDAISGNNLILIVATFQPFIIQENSHHQRVECG